MVSYAPLCTHCWKWDQELLAGMTCQAYPDGIPKSIQQAGPCHFHEPGDPNWTPPTIAKNECSGQAETRLVKIHKRTKPKRLAKSPVAKRRTK